MVPADLPADLLAEPALEREQRVLDRVERVERPGAVPARPAGAAI
jgi:hypothetical protein